jgi:hypothetical protein
MLGATSGIARGTGAVARAPAPGHPHTRRCTMAAPRSRLSRMVSRAVAALAGSRHPVGGGGGGTLSRHPVSGGPGRPALAGSRPLPYTPAAASRLPRPGGLAHHQQTRHLTAQWSAMAPNGAGAGAPAAPVAGIENNGGGEGGGPPDGGWEHRPLPAYLQGMNESQRAAIVAPIAPLKVTLSSLCTCAHRRCRLHTSPHS